MADEKTTADEAPKMTPPAQPDRMQDMAVKPAATAKEPEPDRLPGAEPVKPEPKKDAKPDEKTGVDEIRDNAHADILKAVEEAKTVEASVEALIGRLAPEFETKALEGLEAAEKFAQSLKENAKAFADAVVKNVKDDLPSSESHGSMMKLGARDDPARDRSEHPGLQGAPVPDMAVVPQNEAAAAAVESGLDVHTANSMTGIGSNQ